METYEKLRDRISDYMNGVPVGELPYDDLNNHFRQTDRDVRIREAEELLHIVRKGLIDGRSGYSFQLTLLGWWVYALAEGAENMPSSEKLSIGTRIRNGILDFDVYGIDSKEGHYDYILKPLGVQPTMSAQPQSNKQKAWKDMVPAWIRHLFDYT